jgi:hypothetical protein
LFVFPEQNKYVKMIIVLNKKHTRKKDGVGHISAYSYLSGGIIYDQFCALFHATNATDF